MIGHQALRRFVDRHEVGLTWLGAASFTLFFFATNLYISHNRLLWFDELKTIRTAKLPDLSTLWRLQNSWSGDSAPIVYCLLVRLIYAIFGDTEISVRILSTLAMIAAMMIVFDCARRLKGGTCGLIALCALCTSFLPRYGFEGRPYTLIVLFTTVALWLWLHTKEDSRAAAIAFGLSIFFAITVHFYGVLALAPFIFWDLWHRRWWRPSPKLLAGVAGMLCAVALCAKQMHSGAHWTARSWSPPSVRALVAVYTEIFPYGIFLLTAFVLLACLTCVRAQPISESERFCWLFLTIPLAGFIVAEAATNHFYNRYLIAIVPGVSVAFACLVSRCLTKYASILFVLLAAGIAIGHQFLFVRNVESIGPGPQGLTREALTAESAILADGKKNIIADFLVADAARYYSKHPELYVSYKTDDVLLYYCEDLPCWTPETVKSHARDLAVLYPSNILLREMNHAGVEATIRMTDPMVIYLSPR
jgi:4-amino-4-deoxy-L-arabinose transferase-like glycosyltransferase